MSTTIELPSQFEQIQTQMQYRRAEITDMDDQSVLLRAVPYDVEKEVEAGLFESFEPGAFRGAVKDPARVKLWNDHSDTPRGRIAGVGTEIIDRPDGLDVRAKFSNTDAGQELRSLLRDGILDEASIEFRMMKGMQVTPDRNEDGEPVFHLRHHRGHLTGVAVVPEGAYGRDALVLSVRDMRAKTAERVRAEVLARLNAYNH